MTTPSADLPPSDLPSQREALQIEVDGAQLEVHRIPGRPPSVVMLHEGLGSIALWKRFPDRVAARTGCETVVYSRRGHGWSSPAPLPRRPSFMHEEAQQLDALLDAIGVDTPVLVGHSDGASIALLHAAARAHRVHGLVLMAPHVFVEPLSLASIRRARDAFTSGDLVRKLARYHRDPTHTFFAWNDIWLADDFRAWNIEAALDEIRMPCLVIQGREDEYGTAAQYESIARRASADVLVLSKCGHSPHRDREAMTLSAIEGFVTALAPTPKPTTP